MLSLNLQQTAYTHWRKRHWHDTGARALRAIAEELMVDLMYQLPEEPKPAKYVITRDIVEGKVELATAKQQIAKKESA